MKRICLAVVTGIGAVLSVPTDVAANWQNTRWHQPRAATIAATGAVAVEGDEGQVILGARLGAEGTYEALGYQFHSQFYFNASDQLRVVRLMLPDVTRCAALRQDLEGVYGRSPAARPDTVAWVDVRQGNQVRYTQHQLEGRTVCFVVYQPVGPAPQRGL